MIREVRRNLSREFDQVLNEPERIVDVPQKAVDDLRQITDIKAFWKGLTPSNSPNISKERIAHGRATKDM